jgi:hypothetical protein
VACLRTVWLSLSATQTRATRRAHLAIFSLPRDIAAQKRDAMLASPLFFDSAHSGNDWEMDTSAYPASASFEDTPYAAVDTFDQFSVAGLSSYPSTPYNPRTPTSRTSGIYTPTYSSSSTPYSTHPSPTHTPFALLSHEDLLNARHPAYLKLWNSKRAVDMELHTLR